MLDSLRRYPWVVPQYREQYSEDFAGTLTALST
jgi:hypothetical protein